MSIFAGQYKEKGARPARYEELLGISAGIQPPEAPKALQDQAAEVRGGSVDTALIAARSARLLELTDKIKDPESRARRVKRETLAIRDQEIVIKDPTPAQKRMLALEDIKREEMAIEEELEEEAEAAAAPAERWPSIPAGETASMRRARHKAALRSGGRLIKEGAENHMLTEVKKMKARRVREQQYLSAVQG